MDLDSLRTEIDKIDEKILRLINERARHALEIGSRKRKAGRPILDQEREEKILAKLKKQNPGPLENASIEKVFRIIIEESRNLEDKHSQGA